MIGDDDFLQIVESATSSGVRDAVATLVWWLLLPLVAITPGLIIAAYRWLL